MKFFALSAFILSVSTAPVLAESGIYASILLGGNMGGELDGEGNIQDFTGFEADTGQSYSLGLGYRYNDNFRVETRLTQRNISFDDSVNGFSPMAGTNIDIDLDGDVSSLGLSVDAFYDVGNYGGFTPYVKAGIGVAQNTYSADLYVPAFDRSFSYPEDEITNMTYNVGFGGSYAVSENIDIFAEYQYTYLGEVATAKDSFGDRFVNEDFSVNEFSIGMNYSF